MHLSLTLSPAFPSIPGSDASQLPPSLLLQILSCLLISLIWLAAILAPNPRIFIWHLQIRSSPLVIYFTHNSCCFPPPSLVPQPVATLIPYPVVKLFRTQSTARHSPDQLGLHLPGLLFWSSFKLQGIQWSQTYSTAKYIQSCSRTKNVHPHSESHISASDNDQGLPVQHSPGISHPVDTENSHPPLEPRATDHHTCLWCHLAKYYISAVTQSDFQSVGTVYYSLN